MSRFDSREKCENINNFLKTSELRENVINWYDFKNNSKILKIGFDNPKIVEYFLDNSFSVVLVESDIERVEEAKNIFNDRSNLKIVNSSLEKIFEINDICNKKFDYILLVDVMDRIDEFISFSNRKDVIIKITDICSKLLNNNGTILVSVDNKYSVRNFSGRTYGNTDSFDIISGRKKNTEMYSKKELTDILNKEKKFKFKFYYPLPDYRLPSVIYTDEYLPGSNDSKLNYLVYYNPKDTIVFNEIEVFKEVVKDGKFDIFANSYILELSNNKNNFCKAKFISFNNFRKKENKLITKIYDTYVEKKSAFTEGVTQVENVKKYIELLKIAKFNVIDKVRDGRIYSEYQTLRSLDDIICDYILEDKLDIALSIIENWYRYISVRLLEISDNKKDDKVKNVFEKYGVSISNEDINKLTFLKYGFFDLIFENIFAKLDEKYEFKEFYVYDQEWCEEWLPLEFLLYRALNSLFYHNSKISAHISLELLYKKYGIEQFCSKFKELEQKIQIELLDNNISNVYENTYSALTTLEALQETIYYSKKDYDDIKNQYDSFIKKVEKTNQEWQEATDLAYSKVGKLENEINEKNILIKKLQNEVGKLKKSSSLLNKINKKLFGKYRK